MEIRNYYKPDSREGRIIMDIILTIALLALVSLGYLREKEHESELKKAKSYSFNRGYQKGLYEQVVRICADDSDEAN